MALPKSSKRSRSAKASSGDSAKTCRDRLRFCFSFALVLATKCTQRACCAARMMSVFCTAADHVGPFFVFFSAVRHCSLVSHCRPRDFSRNSQPSLALCIVVFTPGAFHWPWGRRLDAGPAASLRTSFKHVIRELLAQDIYIVEVLIIIRRTGGASQSGGLVGSCFAGPFVTPFHPIRKCKGPGPETRGCRPSGSMTSFPHREPPSGPRRSAGLVPHGATGPRLLRRFEQACFVAVAEADRAGHRAVERRMTRNPACIVPSRVRLGPCRVCGSVVYPAPPMRACATHWTRTGQRSCSVFS